MAKLKDINIKPSIKFVGNIKELKKAIKEKENAKGKIVKK